jgi:hypothetical protein
MKKEIKMKDERSLHLRVQEHADCFATADPLREMSIISKEADKDEAALKWVALAVLHGINSNAKKITITRSNGGSVKVTAKYCEAELPSPGTEVGEKIIEGVRRITHFEGDRGKGPLALGVRNDSTEIGVSVERGESGETVTLKFPQSK